MNIYLTDTTAKTVRSTAKVVENLINKGKKCIVFAEDKITLSLELEIANRLGGGFFDVDVTTFKRYLSSKNESVKVLSKESSVMLVRKIVSDLKGEFGCFKNSIETPSTALVLYELISQLASAKVTPNDLKNLLESDKKLSPALSRKISDVLLVYTEYQARVKEAGVYDSNEYFSLMPEVICGDQNIRESAVIIAGFQSVTKQRLDVFSSLNDYASEFHAVIPYDSRSELYTGETYRKLLKIDSNATVINECGNLPPEAEFIKKHLFTPLGDDFAPMQTESVSLYQATDVLDEAEWLAKDVFEEVLKNGYRYKDIAVAVGSLKDGLPAISRAFKDYNIPFFVEKTTPLSEHPVCDLITAFLDFSRRGLSAKDFVKIVGSGIFAPEKTLADKLVNYVYTNSITRKAFKVPFSVEHPNLSKFESVRSLIMQTENKISSAKTVKEFVSAIKGMLESVNARGNLETLTKKLKKSGSSLLADYNDRVFDKITALLDEMNSVLGETYSSPLDFKNLFLSGAVGTAISSIPILNDAVYVGECKDVKIKSAKVLYAVCLNGDVPFTQSDTALLSDGDLSVLDGFNVIVEPKIKSVNDREKENVAVSLCSFTEKLKISYSNEKSDGSVNFKSDAVKSLSKMFGLKPKTRHDLSKNGSITDLSGGFTNPQTSLMELARNYPEYLLGDSVTREKVASFFKAVDKLQDASLKEKAEQLLTETPKEKKITAGENLSVSGAEISASVLERFFSCPYKNYASNILKLKDSPVLDVQVNETGSLLHRVNELYSEELSKVSDKISSDALVENVFTKVIEEKQFKRYGATLKTKTVLDRLLKESKRVCFNVYSGLKNSSFKNVYREVGFGIDAELPPITIEANSGKVNVKGYIDRVDEYGDYVRIVDYKSGGIDASDESFYTGNKLQLYLYMNALTGIGKKPAGAYYYPVKDVYSKTSEDYVMRGRTVSTTEIITASDNTLAPGGKSTIINVRLKKNGELHSNSSVLTEEEMGAYIDYAKKVSANCVDEIRSGIVTPNPYEHACSYCKYGGMCGFNEEEGDLYRKVKSVNSQTIVEAVNPTEKSTDKAENEDE
ncbi:MAG: PD-(D/E)XK nuclease family protein [Clostridia bacterium]|nr:PD-(D/E)XK nuclease family protein [Clostridia bacterium]